MKIYKFFNDDKDIYYGELFDAGKQGYRMKGCDTWFKYKMPVDAKEMLSEYNEYFIMYIDTNEDFCAEGKSNNLFVISGICAVLQDIITDAPVKVKEEVTKSVNKALRGGKDA